MNLPMVDIPTTTTNNNNNCKYIIIAMSEQYLVVVYIDFKNQIFIIYTQMQAMGHKNFC